MLQPIEDSLNPKALSLSNEWLDYVDDPVEFVEEILGGDPADYQEEALSKLVEERRVSLRGPHGLGKTALAAWAVLWFACTRPDDTKIPTTASAWRQLEKFLWPEIRKWARLADWGKWQSIGGIVPELFILKLKVGEGCEAFALASDNEELIEGAHGTNLLYVFDESKAIPHATWDAAEGAFATGDVYWLAISTPGDRGGRFYDIQRHAPGLEDWWVKHVALEEAIAAGRVHQDWADARKRQWGENSPIYQARVLGEFPEHSDDTLISLTWIEAARERKLSYKDHPQIVGVDIARYGSDDSAMIMRQGPVVLKGSWWHGNDTMQSAGKVKITNIKAKVDVVGIGSGVVDRLKEQDYPVEGINVGWAAIDKEHFANLKSELYWNLRIMFSADEIDLSQLSQTVYDRLSGELTSIKYDYTSKGQIRIEPKDKTRKRIGRSPDVADALCLAYCPDMNLDPVFEILGLSG